MAKEIISFELTKAQTDLLGSLFSKNEIETGMVLGQFFDSVDGVGFVKIGFVSGDEAKRLQEAAGTEPGSLSKTEHEVYTEME